MKVFRSYTHLLILIYIPVMLVLSTLPVFFPNAILQIPHISNIFIFFLLVLSVLPVTAHRPLISEDVSTQSKSVIEYIGVLLKVAGLQLLLIGLFFTIQATLFFPLIETEAIGASVMRITLDNLFVNWGFFPWPLYALVTIVMLHFKNRLTGPKKTGRLAWLSMLEPVLGARVRGVIGMGAEIFLRQASVLSIVMLALVFVGCGMQLLRYLNWPPLHIGPYITSVMIIAALFFILNAQQSQRLFKYLLLQKKQSFECVLLCALCLILLLIPLLNILAQWFVGETATDILIPHLRTLKQTQWVQCWLIFSLSFWLVMMPFVVECMTRITQGFSIRATMAALLWLPVTLTYVWYKAYIPHDAVVSFLSLPLVESGLMLLSCSFISGLCLYSHFVTDVLKQSFCVDHSRGVIKNRLSFSVIQGILQAIIIFILLYLFSGLFFVTLISFATSIMMLGWAGLMFVALLRVRLQ